MIRKISNDIISISVNEHGAELYSVRTSDGTEYIWQGNPKYWGSRAMNIFPVCGRLFGGTYTCNGKSYSMKCHGLVRDADFILSPESGTDRLIFSLTGNDETKKLYPYDFSLLISYTLRGNTLICTNHVSNTGNVTLPFTTGGHPGFNVPLTGGLSFDDYHIDFGKVGSLSKLVLSDTCFVTDKAVEYPLRDGRYIDLKHSLFDNDAIFFEKTPDTVTLASDKDKRSVTLRCPQVKYLGFWHTTRSDAPFLCIEPWIGIPSRDGVIDDMESKPEMVRLAPGDSFDFSYEIIFN